MKTTNTTNTTIRKLHTRLLALLLTIAALLACLALPASAKSAGGIKYYLTESYDDTVSYYAVVTGGSVSADGTLTVPGKIGGNKVWSVGAGAFSDRKDIKKVVISEGVDYISEHAFDGCTNLRTLVIGSASVASNAFAGCTALNKVRITAYKGDIDPQYGWEEEGNDTLFAADREWTRYTKDEADVTSCLKTRVGRRVTLTAEYDTLKAGESYHWYGVNIFPESDDIQWEDCTEKTVTCKVVFSGDQKAVCEVVNSKGKVVWSQEFVIDARRAVTDIVEDAVNDTYLYGVTRYTVNHFRWKLYDCLAVFGVGPYAE